jgi:hypothetical protein
VAKQSPLTSVLPVPIAGEDPELAASRQKYIAAQQAMLDALQARNEFIDPRNLAMARAFLQPTKSGRFGESLGNVMEAYGTADEAERKRNIDIAQIKAEMAAKEVAGYQEAAAMKEFNRLLGGSPKAGQEAAVQDSGTATAPAGFSNITAQSIAQLKRIKPEYGKIVEDMVKFDQDRYLIAMNGTVFDKRTGQYVNPENIPGQTQSEFELPGLGKFLMTPNEYSVATRSRARAAAEGWRDDWDRQFSGGTEPSQIKQPGAPAQPREPGEEPAAPSPAGRKTTTQSALERERESATIRARAEADEKARQAALEKGDTALQRRQAAESVVELVKAPGMDQVLAVLERPGVLPAVGKLIEEGISLGRGYSVSVPQIRDVMTANRITLPKNPGESKQQYDERVQQVLDNLSLLTSRFAEISFGFRSMAQGQGSISNFEQLIFSSMGPTVRDRPRVVQAKAQHMIERANFEEKIRNALLDSNKTFEQFKRSPQYAEMVKEYDAKLRGLYQGMTSGANPQVPGTRPTSQQPYSEAREALRRDILGR